MHAAITTRGMKEKEMERIGNLIADVLAAPSDASVQRRVAVDVAGPVRRLSLSRLASRGVYGGEAVA